ncbi:MAG: porin [Parvibaculaceae bacterium]
MNFRTFLLTGVCLTAFAAPAYADDAAILARLDAMQKAIDAQNQEIASQRSKIEMQSGEIKSLRQKLAKTPATSGTAMVATSAPLATAPATKAELAAVQSELAAYKNTQRLEAQEDAKVTMTNGRPMISSSDGRFTFSPRALAQFDFGFYNQKESAALLPAANGPQLSSGANFRRVALGASGKLFGDFSYLFNFDFGSSNGNEQQGRVQSVYLQYDGLKPFAFRIGAYPPPASIEDGTSATDVIFMERDAPTDAARAIAGADGRDAITMLYTTPSLYGALSLTGGKVADSAVYADEQTALLGRVADMVYTDNDWAFLVGANGSYVITPPYANVAGPTGTHTVSISAGPETTFDDTATKLVSTGAINVDHVTQWGLEGAAQWRSLYAQGGYYGYSMQRVGTAQDPDFNGWYLMSSWVLTGERRAYSAANGSFSSPKPRIPFSFASGGWGAWELALRYSDLDLNFNEGSRGTAAGASTIRGGEQQVTSIGVNWYPNTLVRFDLNLQHVDIDRLSTAGAFVGQDFDVIAFRSQFQF